MLLRGPHWTKLASPLCRDRAKAPVQADTGADRDSNAADSSVLKDLAAELVAAPENVLPLLRFAASHDIAVEVFDAPGGVLAMSNIAPFEGCEKQVTASGKGFGAARAVLACIGEAAEISSWACRPSDVANSVESGSLGNVIRIEARDVLGFSREQIRSRNRLNKSWRGWDSIPSPDHLDNPPLWASVQSFHDDRGALAPAFLCYGRFGDVASGDASLNVDSNGCAAGATLADARTRALLELVERDATGLWWHRGCVRSRLEVAQLDCLDLPSHIQQHRDGTGRRLWLLDISSFWTAKVVAAISCEHTGERMAVGFGAGFGIGSAARSAFLELVQSEAAMQAHAERTERPRDATVSNADRSMTRWKRFADVRNFRFAIGKPTDGPQHEGVGNVDDLLGEIKGACGQQVWFADLSRPEIAIHVTKAICGDYPTSKHAGAASETSILRLQAHRPGQSAASLKRENF